MIPTRHHYWRRLLLRTSMLLLFSTPFFAQQQDENAQSTAKEEVAFVPIAITDIAGSAQAALKRLDEIYLSLGSEQQIAISDSTWQALRDTLISLRADSVYHHLAAENTRRLQNLTTEWKTYLRELGDFGKIVGGRTELLQDNSKELSRLLAQWQDADERATEGEVADVLRTRIAQVVDSTKIVQNTISKRLALALTFQDEIAAERAEIDKVLTLLQSASNQARLQIFRRDSVPLWKSFAVRHDSLAQTRKVSEHWRELVRGNSAFVQANQDRFYLHICLTILLFGLLYYFHVRNKNGQLFDEADDQLRASAFFLSRPFSAAFLVSLFLTVLLYPNRIQTVNELVFLLMLFPLFRLLPGLVREDLRKPVRTILSLYLLDVLLKFAYDFALVYRLLLLVTTGLAIFVFMWGLGPLGSVYKSELRAWPRIIVKSSPILVALLFIALILNIWGNVSLSLSITTSIIETISYAVALLAIASVSDGLVVLLIRRRRAKALYVLQTYGSRLERNAILVIHSIAFFIWLRAILNILALLEPFKLWFHSVLAKTWFIGNAEISVERIFYFFVVIFITFVSSRLLKIILDLEVFPRIKFPRGVPGAINMVVRYSIVGIGLVLALSALGIDLGKFGLLAGAIGVGLGFGLQNIIENFISGIILAFERPIQVGDTIEVDAVFGSVQQIGVRSSTIKTFDGSEVVVPNGSLISNKVTNWTLSDFKRRAKLPVKVAFGSDPHQVIKVLHKVAEEHPDVLGTPAPLATFEGFGEHYLEFTLYYWLSNRILETKSEVALGVHDALKELDIQPARPQRDVTVRMIANVQEPSSGKDIIA